MKRVKLSVEEKLTYRREVVVVLPDGINEDRFESILDRAADSDFMSDFMYTLKKHGIEVSDGYDDDLSSPDECELECYDYTILDEED